MEELAKTVLTVLMAGGPQAVTVLLLGAIWYLVSDNRKLRAELSQRDDRVDALMHRVAEGSLGMTSAIFEFRAILKEVQEGRAPK
jgi:cytochrome P450